MATYLLWFIAIALEAAILFRAARLALLRRFPLFYTHVVCVFLCEFLRFFCYRFASPHFFQIFYWDSECILFVTGYAILVDIFRRALKYSPGVLRLGQKLLLIVFVAAASYAVSEFLHAGFVYWPWIIANAGRQLRNVEGVVLVAMLWLFGHYRISLGRNLLGLTIGYSLVVGLDVSDLAFMVHWRGWHTDLLTELRPITYVITLAIWCVSLWSSHPEPVQPTENMLERDYTLLLAKTKGAFAHLSARVGRTLGS